MTTFDADAAASPGSGVFGLSDTEQAARVVLLPVPFDATTSYRRGAAKGPALILEASRQLDLLDREVGSPYKAGIHMREAPREIRAWNRQARKAADPVIEAGGVGKKRSLRAAADRVNHLSSLLNEAVYEDTRGLLAQGKIVGVVGGDHSVPFGAIRAYAERHPGMGILHIDAHADLRDAFEGFAHSHASIMHNVMTHIDGVGRLVQVGIRDFGAREEEMIRASGGRIRAHFDVDMARARFEGATWKSIVDGIVADLPGEVYVSFDIDGLDPALCPGTGTPVAGGLSFHEASYLIGAVARAGKRIVGFDLNEVAPGPDRDEWNGNVGARVLYKLIGWTLLSQDHTADGVTVSPSGNSAPA
jgi:agmatinase